MPPTASSSPSLAANASHMPSCLQRATILRSPRRSRRAIISPAAACAPYVRARNIGLTEGDRFQLPLTQAALGDALGLTSVHVNRVLRKLRLDGAMTLTGGTLEISDILVLAAVAGFDDSYLHRRIGPKQVAL